MLKKILLLLPILVGYTLSNADTLLDSVQSQTVNVSSQENSATGVKANLVRKSAPTSYTVKKSDTVMKLAQMYLTKSGYWAKFLGVKSLADTHLYPGNNLRILSVGGNKILLADRKSSSNGIDKLEPTVRYVSLEELPPISTKALKSLFLHPTLMPEKDFESLPMIVGGAVTGQLYFTSGDRVYLKGYLGQAGDKVAIFSKMRKITDPDTQENLGYEVRYDGDGIIDQTGPVTSMDISYASNQVADLDRVAALPDQEIPDIVPHKSEQIITGKIVELYDAITSTAENNTVVINRGARDGVDIGQVFEITDTHKFVDPTSPPDEPKYLLAPPETIGEILIYKVYDKLSFGLITDSSRPIRFNAVVQSQQ
ncbi:MAG: hypothetical protein KA049_01765 [Burkholderiales bacterium]|jgi:LysM repeat protein|nr:hypothetical protein [Burkholderiales bacterium]MBP9769129.1 hypothetical protein [Burkholderiales bacterium]